MKRGFVVLFVLAFAPFAFAQSQFEAESSGSSTHHVRTAADYAHAQPFPLPRVAVSAVGSPAMPEPPDEAGADPGDWIAPAAPPTLADRGRFARVLYDPRARGIRTILGSESASGTSSVGAPAWGLGGLDFTSTRLIPTAAAEVFPYSAVGKIFFSDGTDDFTCSGAVIAERLVLTAAHCLHGGPGVGFYQDVQFIPAYQYGVAPFGVWELVQEVVTHDWAINAEVPHPHDWGIFEVADQDGATIASVVGRLTIQLNRLADNHLHLLGYPFNLDEGEELHQITSGDFLRFEDHTVVYGSDMSGGSSGGPWVQNFSLPSAGQSLVFGKRRLAVVGVTSYGFTNEAIQVQGASVLTRLFRDMFAFACDFDPGNC